MPLVLGVITGTLLLLTTVTGFVSVWAANLFGTSGPDTLVGTDKDDSIYGLGGNDKISDGLGSDKVYAGSGDDTIKLEGTGDTQNTGAQDVVYGERGRDNIDAQSSDGAFLLIYGGDDEDTINGGHQLNRGQIYAGSGNDIITTSDADFDVWAGSGDDYMDGASECGIRRAFGESGNDRIIQANDFASGGSGNDFIQFSDCTGVAYGDSGDDDLRGDSESTAEELHGGSGDDTLFVPIGFLVRAIMIH